MGHEQAIELVCALLARELKSAPRAEAPKELKPVASPRSARHVPRRAAPLEALSVNIGRDDVRDVRALKALIAELGGLLPEDISSVQMKRSSSQIEVPQEFSSDLVEALNGEPYGSRLISVKRVSK